MMLNSIDPDVGQKWIDAHYYMMGQLNNDPFDSTEPLPEEPPPAEKDGSHLLTVNDGDDQFVYELSRTPLDVRTTPGLGGKPFNKKSYGLTGHVSPYDNAKVKIGTDNIEVRLLQGINERDMSTVLAACERATIGMELSDIEQLSGRPDEDSEMFKGGLQTALESQVVVFAVRGVDRTITHQIVRSRRAAFHQQSQRASFMGDCPEVRIPETVWNASESVKSKWLSAIAHAHAAYRAACNEDVPFQDARYILPEGTDTFIICEYTLRELMNVYNYRACYMFQWGIRDVMHKMKAVLVEAHPWMEEHLKISCERTNGAKDAFRQESYEEQQDPNAKRKDPEMYAHTCTFQGWEEVEGHCPLAWARESNRQFKSERHGIAPK
jgi:thymidylate synthase (FAD)